MNEQPRFMPTEFTSAALPFSADALGSPQPAWIWQGILARGQITLLTSQWKSGKTTLLSHLLARRRSSKPLAGFAVTPGKSLLFSEEHPSLWGQRHRRLHFGDDVYFLCRAFADLPRGEVWPALIAAAADLKQKHGFDLLVVDPLAYFLPPYAEGNASLLVDALRPLQQLAAQDLSVLLLHHPTKGETVLGQAARGSGALPGLVDILAEMDFLHRADLDDRRRRLHVLARCDASPRQFVVELNADGSDYTNLGSPLAVEFKECWTIISHLLANAGGPLSRRQLVDLWPDPARAPHPGSLWRFLERAIKEGLVEQQGRGTKNCPFRFRLKHCAAA